jgi:hypothetical protein
VAATVVRLPEAAQSVLAADVPYLEVDGRVWRWKRECGNVLPNGRNGLQVGVRGCVGCLDLLKERRLAGIVEAKEKDRILWGVSATHFHALLEGGAEEATHLLYLLHASKSTCKGGTLLESLPRARRQRNDSGVYR